MKLNIAIQKTAFKGILTACMAGSFGMLVAQTPADSLLNRTVVVEQEYNPNVMDARKVNVLPQVENITVTPGAVQYEGRTVPAVSVPGAPISAYAAQEKQDATSRGFIRTGYGNLGNVDGKASYLFDLSPRDRIDLGFSFEGMNGKIKIPGTDVKWKSRYYRTLAGLNYIHQFDRVNMDISGNFGLVNLNYLPRNIIDKQKFTFGDVHLGVKSTDDTFPLQFKAETNLMLYSRGHDWMVKDKSINETRVRTKADVTGEINDTQKIGVGLEMNNMFYNQDMFDNYTTLLLNPYYTIGTESASVRLGVNVDLSFNHGNSVRVSPDVLAQYTFSDSYVLYAQATGGKLINDMRRLERITPYGLFMSEMTIVDTYEQVNGRVGFKASPVTGLWLNIFGGYQNYRNDLYEESFNLTGNVPAALPALINPISYSQTNTNNINAGARIQYEYKNYVSVSGEGRYFNWKADNELALVMKPRFILDFRVGVSPIIGLNANLGYELMKRNEIKLTDGTKYREEDLSNLYLSGDYTIYDRITVFVKASNLLNKKYSYYLNSPAQGTNFMAGLSLRF